MEEFIKEYNDLVTKHGFQITMGLQVTPVIEEAPKEVPKEEPKEETPA